MKENSPRWHEVTASEFEHERAGLRHIRELLPDRGPFQVWTNFEFRDKDGKWFEVDALVLGERRLHLVELKHYQGTITGNAYRWQRNGRSEDSPLLLARRKAQRLKGVITTALKELQPDLNPIHIPYVQHCVFLHAEDGTCALPLSDATDLFGLDGRERRSGLQSIALRLLESPTPGAPRPGLIERDDLLVRLFETIGFALRREREVGAWRLIGPAMEEGDGWQDWPAEHRVARKEAARVRFFVSKPGASEAERKATRQLAEREYDLTRRLNHDGVLRPRDLVDDELGVGLVYPRDESAQRLDLWLDEHGPNLALAERVAVIRQIAEALAYVHRHHVVHRGLTPAAVRVRQQDHEMRTLLGDWQVAGLDQAGTTRTSGAVASRLLAVLEEREAADPQQQRAQAYLAPESRVDPSADRVRLDVFALGAVAYHIIAGRPPATDSLDLRDRARRDRGLDLVADVPEVPASLRRLVLQATRPAVTERLPDLQEFLKQLDVVDQETASSANGALDDPLDAPAGTLLGQRFELLGRLGSGSTAVGLLVADRAAGGEQRVLKVARNDAAVSRLRGEAEVLTSLQRLNHPRLIRLLEPEPLRIGSRTALLLDSAGETTLAKVLRERARLSIDLLDRWGTELLEAMVALDKANVDHRDIKPANLGVREGRGDRTKHLVLFDFSLSQAGASAVEAGTPPYLDPFLGTANRPNWDSAAERYAATVTLFEMATGRTPRFGDGLSDPATISGEASVDPALFDPAVAVLLADFFGRALRRDARQRFHTAADMLAAWRDVFPTTTVPDDADALAAAATAATALTSAGLSGRAISALEPLHVLTVGDLAAVDPVRLSRLSGAAESTRREVRARAKQWREHFGPNAATSDRDAVVVTGGGADDPLADPLATAETLVRAAGPARATARRGAARRILGLAAGAPDNAPFDAFATLADLASALGVGGQPQVSRLLSDLQQAWADDDEARARLDGVLARAAEVLAGLGGLATADDLVTAMADEASTPGLATARVVAGLLRLAMDRAETTERGGGEAAPLVRRRRRAGRGQMFAIASPLLDVADGLGRRADELVAAAAAAGEDVVPLGRTVARLRPLWPTEPVLDDIRLVRLAARLSTRSAASRRGELHDRRLAPASAVAIALGGLAPAQRLTPADVTERVRARFPELADLPARPDLDRVMGDAMLSLVWTGEAYTIPPRSGETTLSSHVPTADIAIVVGGGRATREDEQLTESVQRRSFLAIGVPPRWLDRAAGELVRRCGARVVDITAVLLAGLRAEAEAKGVPWDSVRAADAAEPGSRPAQGLAALVRASVPLVEQVIAEAIAAAPGPVLLIEAAPLGRYGHTDVLARLADITTGRRQAVWLLVPEEHESGASLDGIPLPLAHGGQFLRLDAEWVGATAVKGGASA